MKLLATITLDTSPETIEHAQHVIDNDLKFRAWSVEVKEIIK